MTCTKCGVTLSPDARFCPSCGSALAPTQPSPSGPGASDSSMIGREVAGRYRILEKLGEGGMGAVFRAEQISLKRKVALKLLRPELSANPGLVRRFNAEAELAAKLNHPNTVTLFDFGQDADGALFIAMEFVDGESLRTAIAQSGPLQPARALAICEQVCASLADAHAAGIVHRDLKPDNVMLTRRGDERDVVRVLDFGIAKLRDERPDGSSVPMTQQGDLLGTPQYMAPEQIRAEQVDGRTDVYALGAMLYEMITGRLPFEGPTVMAVLSKHLTEPPEPPMDRRRDLGIPPHINQIVLDCMQKDPAARPQTMRLLGARLRQLRELLGEGQLATRRPPSMPIKRYQSRPPGVPQWTPSRGHDPMPRTPAPQTPPPQAPPPQTPPPQTPPGAWSGPPPAMPAPTPAPAAGPPAARGWIWLVAALLVIAGGVAAFVALGGVGGAGGDGDGTAAAAVPDEPDQPARADDGFRSPITGDFSTHPDRELYELDDALGDVERRLDDASERLERVRAGGFVPGDTAGDDSRYVNSEYGYAIELPDGFSANQDPNNAGMVTAAGMIDGELAMIVAVAMPVDPAVLGDEGMKAAAENIASGFGGTVVRVERKRIQGARLYTGIYDMQQAMRMEIVLYPASGFVLAVAFGTPPDAFGSTAATRADLFEHRVHPRR